MIRVGDVELWTEAFGDPAHPTVLLIQGPGTGLAWPEELCESLVEGGRHVIRYDHRDTGRSTTVDFASQPYTLSDVAADAVGVLDAYGVATAHLVGFSMGGMIAQIATLEHPERVASLTSWGSTPLGVSFFDPGGDGPLPGPDEKVLAALEGAGTDDPADMLVRTMRSFSGTLEPFDEPRARALAERMAAQTRAPTAFMNHWAAGAASPDRTEALAVVRAPTLVIHGSVDPAAPPAHGEATARAIPGSRLLMIEGLGHDFPRVVLPRIADAILEHTAPVGAGRAGR